MAKEAQDNLVIHRWEAENIQDALRMLNNLMHYTRQVTCLDRELISTTNTINNVLNGIPNKAPNRFKVDTEYSPNN